MKRFLLAGAAILGLAGTANAVPIAAGSVLNIVGAANFTATQVMTSTPAALTQNTGSFAPLLNCLTCVTVNAPVFTYAPKVGSGLLFTVNELGITATITVNPGGTFQHPSVSALAIEAPATLTLTGIPGQTFDPTNGDFVWTINQLGGLIGSFSATAQATAPEPASIAILGAGLIGLGFVANRKRS
jgi:hypothetical protein